MNIASTPKERLYFWVARYFKHFANISLQRWQPRIVAITGSTGKTTLLELLDFQLGERVHFSHDANSIYGIAFDILGLKGVSRSRLEWIKLFILAPIRAHRFTRDESTYVVEIDAGRPNGARIIADWLQPSITALTGIEQSHAEFYEAVVASGKYESFTAAISDEFMSVPRATSDLLIVPAESAIVHKALKQNSGHLPARIIQLRKDDQLQSYQVAARASRFEIGKKIYRFATPQPEAIWLQLAMMQEICRQLGEPNTRGNLTTLTFPPGRSSVFDGIKQTTLIDSSYNAQLSSMLAILDMYRRIDAQPKWVVVGDIIELGSRAAEQHQLLAKYLAKYPADQLILVGKRCQKYIAPLLPRRNGVLYARDAHVALDFLKTNLKGHETILFKGSQHLEWIIAHLLATPADRVRLPRQSPAEQARLARLGYR